MKKYLATASQRDKNTLFVGGLIILIISLIALWHYVGTQISLLEQQIRQNQVLLLWMQDADRRLQAPGHTGTKTIAMRPAAIQSALEQANMTAHIAKMRQNEKGAVELSLTQVNFDDLLRLLEAIQKNTGATPLQIHITRGTTSGSVNAEMLLQEE